MTPIKIKSLKKPLYVLVFVHIISKVEKLHSRLSLNKIHYFIHSVVNSLNIVTIWYCLSGKSN